MKKKEFIGTILLMLLAAALLFSCVPGQYRDKEGGDLGAIEKMKIDALSDILKKDGDIKDKLPPTSVMIFGTLIPISAIVGFFVVLFVFLRLNHRKNLALIEKGKYQPVKLNIRWDLIFLFIGLITAFAGIGVSLWMVGYYGVFAWSILSGVIPFFVGSAFIVFYLVYRKAK